MLLATVVAVLGCLVTTPSTIASEAIAVPLTFTYDVPGHDDLNAHHVSERAPPASYVLDHHGSAVHHESRGPSARPEPRAAHRFTIYDPDVLLVQVDSGSGCGSTETANARRSDRLSVSGRCVAAKTADTVVLGHYPEYVDLAKATGGRTFQIPTKIWDSMSPAEQWGANQKFLDRAIARGSNVRLATPANAAREGSYFERELQYMQARGYTVGPDGTSLLAPGGP